MYVLDNSNSVLMGKFYNDWYSNLQCDYILDSYTDTIIMMAINLTITILVQQSQTRVEIKDINGRDQLLELSKLKT